MNPRLTASIVVLAAMLALANAMVFLAARGPASPTQANWRAWAALAPSDRAGYVSDYWRLESTAEGRGALAAARQFAQLPARQTCLRELYRVLADVMERQPPAERRELRLRAPRARAWSVYDWLRREDSARADALAAQLRACQLSAPG